MKTLLVATFNQGKIREIRDLLGQGELSILSLADMKEQIEIEEDGDTFELNAIKKALTACRETGLPTLADDSGLEVDALGGQPGVYSARYGGDHLDDKGRYELLLKKLEAVEQGQRTARFRATLAYLPSPKDNPLVFDGTLEGHIAFRPAGAQGFGYDPIFVPNGYDRTLAELGPNIKNRISHRAKALRLFIDCFRQQN